jgi:hypothetical protein
LTCFRFDISPHIQLLRCCRHKKAAWRFITKLLAWVSTTSSLLYVLILTINNDNLSLKVN